MIEQRSFQPGDLVWYYKHETVRERSNRFLYRIVANAENADTGEHVIVYQALYGDMCVYALPYAFFSGKVDKHKNPGIKQEYLFEKIENKDPLIEPVSSPSANIVNNDYSNNWGTEDRITGLPNLASFDSYCKDQKEDHHELHLNIIALVMIDSFYELKKQYSLEVFNSIVVRLADKLAALAQDDIKLARYDESGFILCCHDVGSIDEVKARLRHLASSVRLTVGDSRVVTVSIGIAQCRHNPQLGYRAAIEKARHALYMAQERGGAQIAYFAEPEDINVKTRDGSVLLPPERDIYIRTFGHFAVFLNGSAVVFHHEKAKELLAILTALRGNYLTAPEAIGHLWENETDNELTQTRYRKTALRLKEDLSQYGIEDIVLTEGRKRRLDTSKVRCDLFDYLSGKKEYEHLYHGFFMTDYWWGESMNGEMTIEKQNYSE